MISCTIPVRISYYTRIYFEQTLHQAKKKSCEWGGSLPKGSLNVLMYTYEKLGLRDSSSLLAGCGGGGRDLVTVKIDNTAEPVLGDHPSRQSKMVRNEREIVQERLHCNQNRLQNTIIDFFDQSNTVEMFDNFNILYTQKCLTIGDTEDL